MQRPRKKEIGIFDKRPMDLERNEMAFICLGCYNNTIDWVYKQRKFISHSSGGREVQDQVLADSVP